MADATRCQQSSALHEMTHGRYLESMALYQKSDAVNQCIFSLGPTHNVYVPMCRCPHIGSIDCHAKWSL